MELVFQEKQLDYLGRVLDQTVTQELTAEVIVPDSCADADRVVDAFGTLLVRAEECTAGSASVSGEVQAGILFVTEDGRLERLETVIPFSARRGWEGEQSDCRLQCVCRLCSVDARLVHSRKLLVRVGVSCTLTVYAAFTLTLHDFPEPAPTLQLRRKRLPLRLPRGLGEKSFSLNEEIEIPASKPPVERLLKCVYALDTAERKTIGNKAVFKGRLTVHILYEAPDGSLQRQETELPFSQFAELEQDLDEGDLTVFLALTSAETEPDGQLDCRRLLLSAGILAQCTVCGEQPVELIEDAYCLDAELKPQWETWEMEGILDVQTFRETAQAAGREPASAIADGWVLAGEPVRRQENGMARAAGNGACAAGGLPRHGDHAGRAVLCGRGGRRDTALPGAGDACQHGAACAQGRVRRHDGAGAGRCAAARRHPAAHGAAGAGLGYRKGLPHCAGDGHGGK